LRLFSTQIQDIYSKLIKCICSTDPNCQRESPIYDIQYPPDFPDADDRNYNISYIVPGATVGCSAIGSLLLSTLECFLFRFNLFLRTIAPYQTNVLLES